MILYFTFYFLLIVASATESMRESRDKEKKAYIAEKLISRMN